MPFLEKTPGQLTMENGQRKFRKKTKKVKNQALVY